MLRDTSRCQFAHSTKEFKHEAHTNLVYCVAFAGREGHTLGNALRFVVMSDPQTEFAGYSIVHPSETFMNLRVQTREENTNETLKRGLDNLGGMAKAMRDKLRVAVDNYGN